MVDFNGTCRSICKYNICKPYMECVYIYGHYVLHFAMVYACCGSLRPTYLKGKSLRVTKKELQRTRCFEHMTQNITDPPNTSNLLTPCLLFSFIKITGI